METRNEKQRGFVKTLLAAFVGTLVALALVAGVSYVYHPNGKDEKTNGSDMPVDERFFAYFDENNIPYQKYDSADVYVFEYGDMYYLFHVSAEKEFVRILAFGDTIAGADYHTLLEAANETLIEKGGANVFIVNEKGIMFTVEHMVDDNTDVAKLFPRLMSSMETNRETFYDKFQRVDVK